MATKKIDPKLRRLVKKYIRYWRARFRLPQWPVFFSEYDEVKDKWGIAAVMGIDINVYDAEVRLSFRQDLVPDEELIKRLICHEMLHWVLDTMDRYVEAHISKRSDRIYTDYLETVIETIALAFTEPERKLPAGEGWYVEDHCEQKKR